MGMKKTQKLVRSFLTELAIYGVLMTGYFFLVMHFLGGWIKTLFNENKPLYAIVALLLMIGQGVFAGGCSPGGCSWWCGRKRSDRMDFPISGAHINPAWLIIIGFLVGVTGDSPLAWAGSFLAGPALFALGVPMKFRQWSGRTSHTSWANRIVAARKHYSLGNVDMKLVALHALLPTILGSEGGAQLIQYLKRRSDVTVVVGAAYIVVLTAISLFMLWESWRTIQEREWQKERAREEIEGGRRCVRFFCTRLENTSGKSGSPLHGEASHIRRGIRLGCG